MLRIHVVHFKILIYQFENLRVVTYSLADRGIRANGRILAELCVKSSRKKQLSSSNFAKKLHFLSFLGVLILVLEGDIK